MLSAYFGEDSHGAYFVSEDPFTLNCVSEGLNIMPLLVQIMAWRRTAITDPMMD